MRTLTYALIPATICTLGGCEKYALDQQMEELCKKDGGVKVHETVTVSVEWLDFAGRPNLKLFPSQDVGGGLSRQTVAGEYVIEIKHQDIKRPSNDSPGLYTEGRLSRYTTSVLRLSDNKILGEQIGYGRSGGDLTLGHPGSNFCPKPSPNPDVVQSVFHVKE